MCWLVVAVVSSVQAFSIQVHSDPAVAGSNLTIMCRLTYINGSQDITQITWQRRTKAYPQNVNFMSILPRETVCVNHDCSHIKFAGDFSKGIANLVINDARDEDSGTYTCIFTLFPAGNQKAEIAVQVWTKPRISVRAISAVAEGGCVDEQIPFAVCYAEGGNPAPRVRWTRENVTAAEEKAWDFTTAETRKTNTALEGAVDIESVLYGVPRVDWNGEKMLCVVESPDNSGRLYRETVEVRVNVTYAPEAPVVALNMETGELECRADANPPASVSWERPQDIVWECVAKNNYGISRSRVYRVESTPARVTRALYGVSCLAMGMTTFTLFMWCRWRKRHSRVI